MFRSCLIALAALLALPSTVRASNVAVTVDTSSATAVLNAVRDPNLTAEQALSIARLPGNQGLIRKAQSYGRTATDAIFGQALVAAAHHDTAYHDTAYQDTAKFQFNQVRDHAAQIEPVLTAFNDPSLHLLANVQARIALFTPPALAGKVTGYLVVGGSSGGFAFGDPQFYLNLDLFPSAALASTIMEHELFHAVQGLARSAHKPQPSVSACLAKTPHATDLADLYNPLSAEGTASYVGDLLALPAQGTDEPTAKERAEFAQNVGMVHRSITQMELSVHGLVTGASVKPEDIYELRFYGDQVLYALGYVMARAIAQEQGNAAIGEVISQPGAAFVTRYVNLKGYGKSHAVPTLDPETVLEAQQINACFAQGS